MNYNEYQITESNKSTRERCAYSLEMLNLILRGMGAIRLKTIFPYALTTLGYYFTVLALIFTISSFELFGY